MHQQKTKWPQVLQEMSNPPPPTKHQSVLHNSDHNNNGPCVDTELTKFLVKKELLLSRLSAFKDKPENYLMLKGSFSIIMKT